MNEVWSFEHSVHCRVPREWAWNFWTTVEHSALDADIDSVEIEGPFAPGARGLTRSKSSGGVEWRVADVEPGRSAVLEFPAPGALAVFTWTFQDDGATTIIKQRASLTGENAQAIAIAMGPALEAGLPAGMQKLCEAIEADYRPPGSDSSVTTKLPAK